MSDYDQEKLMAFVKEKWKGANCPMCGGGDWSIQNKIFKLMEFTKQGLVVGGPVIPVIPVVCNNCGNTILMNAIVPDLVEKEGGAK
jgi:hypothetical protein